MASIMRHIQSCPKLGGVVPVVGILGGGVRAGPEAFTLALQRLQALS